MARKCALPIATKRTSFCEHNTATAGPWRSDPLHASPALVMSVGTTTRVLLLAWLLAPRVYAEPGDLDPSFTGGVTNYPSVGSIALQPDGKILCAGTFTIADDASSYRIARLHPDGALDTNFHSGDTYIDSTVYSIALQADGHVFIGGDFLHVGGAQRFYVARLNSDGTLDTVFNPGRAVNRDVFSLAAQTNGQVIIGGDFSAIGPTNINGIARLNSNGSLDTNFNVGSGTYGAVYKVAVQHDGKI